MLTRSNFCSPTRPATLISSAPIKGITKELLMGDIADLSLLPVFQMALPFAWEQQRGARLYETIS